MHSQKQRFAIYFLAAIAISILSGCSILNRVIDNAKEYKESKKSATDTSANFNDNKKDFESTDRIVYVEKAFRIEDENLSVQAIRDTVYLLQRRADNFLNDIVILSENNERIIIKIPKDEYSEELLDSIVADKELCFIYGMGALGNQNIELTFSDDGAIYSLLCSIDEIYENEDVILDATHISKAACSSVAVDTGEVEDVIQLQLTDEGAERFEKATLYASQYYGWSDNNDRYRNIIAIVYGDEVISAPSVISVISDGKATISGLHSYEEAMTIASIINMGHLPLKLIEE